MKKMTVVYYREKPPESFERAIFLAGPSPKKPEEAWRSWRPNALKELEASGFDGVVFVPEFLDPTRPGNESYKYDDMVKWEHNGIEMSDCVLFWVPRDLKTMPGLTTNIEFGWQLQTGKVIFGAPTKAPRMSYSRYMCKRYRVPSFRSLRATVRNAIKFTANGALRIGGERKVPLHIWHTASFQSWITAHKSVGNRLDDAELIFVVTKNKNKTVVLWGMRSNVYIKAENRHKWNEGVFARPDLSSVVIYNRNRKFIDLFDTKIVLVKEFRQAVNNKDCMVHDLPGGSAPDFGTDYLNVAHEEVLEETGHNFPKKRFIYEGSRQVASTLSSHRVHLYSIEATDKEMAYFEGEKGKIHGADPENETGERVYVEVSTLRQIMQEELVDWGIVGMINKVVHDKSQK